MTTTLIRGRHVVTGTGAADTIAVLDDAAVLQRDGMIQAVGPWEQLSRRPGIDEVIGSADHVVLPGLVNAHHHIGLTPVQLGVRDEPLELWFIARMAGRDVDPYLDTLYSAFEMLRSGVTTVQHITALPRGPIDQVAWRYDRILQAYLDVGMRVSFALGLRDQNFFTYEPESELLARLPAHLVGPVQELLRDYGAMEDHLDLYDDLHRRHADAERIRIQLAPANLHWCSDRALTAIADRAERSGALLHIHLVETAYQREYARRRSGGTALEHLHRFGLAGPALTIGHGTWLTESDLDLAAATGVHICHNCSSNLRLRSGIAPLQAFKMHGLNVALGLDEAGINDDRDMLQEMRLALHLHRTPGMDDVVPTPEDIVAMASGNGARTTPFGDSIGELAPGKCADLVTLRWSVLAGPYLDAAMPALAATLHRAKPEAVDHVMVGGRLVVRGGEIATMDRHAVLDELAHSLAGPLQPHEQERRRLSQELFGIVKQYYESYLGEAETAPFYRYNARR